MTVSNEHVIAYEAGKKSSGVAYFLWLLFGALGVHRFYANSPGIGAAYLLLFLFSLAAPPFFVIVGLMLIFDLFYIPGLIRKANLKYLQELQGS